MDKINIPTMTADNTEMLFDGKFLRFTDLHPTLPGEYVPDKHYYNATRREKEDLVALKSDKEFQTMTADAVSCIVILDMKDSEPKLLLTYEYRYPAGRFLLSVPAGLVDEEDKQTKNPLISATMREIKEETGLDIKSEDLVKVLNPFLFSSPGMTDEGNALVCAVIQLDGPSCLSQAGAVGTELFNGFKLVTRKEALEILNNGRDEYGNFYSMHTWAALMCFTSSIYPQAESEGQAV